MKQITLAVLLLTAFAWAKAKPDSAYSIDVHVTATRMVVHHSYVQQLNAVIDGKKYVLEAEIPQVKPGLLKLGDYKARLREDRHHKDYDSWQVYEFLLPDNQTRRFVVMEITE